MTTEPLTPCPLTCDKAHGPLEQHNANLAATVTVEVDDRLSQLHAQYAGLKAAADAAAEALKACTDGIKAELAARAPEGSTRIDLHGPHGPALRLAYAERVTFDSKRLKAVDPETYVRFAKFGGAWSLRAVGPSGGDD